MSTIEVTDKNFREMYQKNEIVILDFWASWCGPCHQFAPIYEEISKEHPDILFGKVQTENEEELSKYFIIQSIPTTIVIRDELEVFRHSGVIGREDLRALIDKVKKLDMAEVEKSLAEE